MKTTRDYLNIIDAYQQTGTYRAAARDLVGAFFDEIDVSDGRIVTVVPRAEYAAEVVPLLEHVDRERRRSPGGIRGNVQSTPPLVPILRSA